MAGWQRRLLVTGFSAHTAEATWAELRDAALAAAGKDAASRPRARRLVLVTVARHRDAALARALETAARRLPGRHIAVMLDVPAAQEEAVIEWFTPEGCGESEVVRLALAGERARHWPEMILPLLKPELPAYLYLPDGAVPGTATALVGMDHVVLDTTAVADPAAAWRAVTDTASPRPAVSDLAWTRLTPWRQALAFAFDPPPRRALLGRIEQLEVGLEGGLAAWLVAWLASRLGLVPAGASTLRYADDRIVAVVKRPSSPPAVRLAASNVVLRLSAHGRRLSYAWSDAPRESYDRTLGPHDAGVVLADTLAQGFDPVFQEALAWQTREEALAHA